jgi:hypothetical protein
MGAVTWNNPNLISKSRSNDKMLPPLPSTRHLKFKICVPCNIMLVVFPLFVSLTFFFFLLKQRPDLLGLCLRERKQQSRRKSRDCTSLLKRKRESEREKKHSAHGGLVVIGRSWSWTHHVRCCKFV